MCFLRQQTLDMHVPAVTAANESVSRDVRGLSGGERSYSTVCLICSLWVNTASTPFRVLDEFDIFMDMSKRRKSLQMLLQVCQVQTGCQFIFLTPLEMPKLEMMNGTYPWSCLLHIFVTDRTVLHPRP